MKILILFLVCTLATYATSFSLSNFNSQKDMTPHMEYLIDNEKNLTIDAVQTSSMFEPMEKSNFGIQSFVLWTKLHLANDTNQTQFFILANSRPAMDKLDVYLIAHDNITSYQIGEVRPMSNRPVHHRHSVVPINLAPGETVSVITRYENIGVLEGGWMMLNSNQFIKFSIKESMIFGAFGGLMLALIIYNVMMYFSLKDNAFLFYIFYAICAFTFQYIMSGVFYEWNIIDGELLNHLTYPLGYSISVFLILFNSAFFKTRDNFPKIYTLTSILALTIAILTSFAFYVQQTPYLYLYTRVLNIIVLISLMTLFLTGIYFIIQKKIGAYYYTLGQGVFFLLYAHQLLILIGVFETSEFDLYAALIGIFVDMIFLSIALGYKVKYLREEKEHNEKIILLTSRFASMGQVVGNIAHQWKVPLVRLGSLMMELESYVWSKSENLRDNVSVIIPKMRETLHFMDETIIEFSEFYKSDNTKISFGLKQQIEEIENLLSAKSIALNASIEIDSSCELDYFGFKNALTQVIMIIIDNALDIAKIRKINHPKIKIYVQRLEKKLLLNIEDNCGGIKQMPIDTIFELFTSYETSKNSGMGLAIAKKMIEHKLNGEIFVKNTAQGTVFSIFIPI